ncbi:hypothetical protein HMN09_01071000 [Mycena chlorophos]|uniref:Uncharacterized protein n=1 Tax=Mycena chlorophos TaxID=658473 RepID=A0A8H6W029_MYCCL|nr:hypothetical protein HMN09_01071000 [Mycena chlorophos]
MYAGFPRCNFHAFQIPEREDTNELYGLGSGLEGVGKRPCDRAQPPPRMFSAATSSIFAPALGPASARPMDPIPSPSGSPERTRPSFQLTSAESFEASLMAGGYGLYKTAEWVRQPSVPGDIPLPAAPPQQQQPNANSKPHGHAHAHFFKKPDVVVVQPPTAAMTEKQLRKKRRVDKFRANGNNGLPSGSGNGTTRLVVGELRGMGRVIMDESPQNGVYTEATALAAARRPAEERRRKKMAVDAAVRERERKEALAASHEDCPTQPNWPDDDFPWRLSEERRIKLLKEDRELRMRYIEEFFAADTDEEDDAIGQRSRRIL